MKTTHKHSYLRVQNPNNAVVIHRGSGVHIDVFPNDVTAAFSLIEDYIVQPEKPEDAAEIPKRAADVLNRAKEHIDNTLIGIAFDPLPPMQQRSIRYEALSKVAIDVLSERRKQIDHGYTSENDDRYAPFTLSFGAMASISMQKEDEGFRVSAPHGEVAKLLHLRNLGARQNLVRAAALLIAEIERMDRDAARKAGA